MNHKQFKRKALKINPELIFHQCDEKKIRVEIRERVKYTYSQLYNFEGWSVTDVSDHYFTPKVIITFECR